MKIDAVSLVAVYIHTICLDNKIKRIDREKDSDVDL